MLAYERSGYECMFRHSFVTCQSKSARTSALNLKDLKPLFETLLAIQEATNLPTPA